VAAAVEPASQLACPEEWEREHACAGMVGIGACRSLQFLYEQLYAAGLCCFLRLYRCTSIPRSCNVTQLQRACCVPCALHLLAIGTQACASNAGTRKRQPLVRLVDALFTVQSVYKFGHMRNLHAARALNALGAIRHQGCRPRRQLSGGGAGRCAMTSSRSPNSRASSADLKVSLSSNCSAGGCQCTGTQDGSEGPRR